LPPIVHRVVRTGAGRQPITATSNLPASSPNSFELASFATTGRRPGCYGST
jgi:hypothetical protein